MKLCKAGSKRWDCSSIETPYSKKKAALYFYRITEVSKAKEKKKNKTIKLSI